MVTIIEIARQLGMTDRTARRKMRASDWPHAFYERWKFRKGDVAKVIKLLNSRRRAAN